MSDLHLLIPKTKAILIAAAGAGFVVHLNEAVGIGSILVASIIVIVAGVFTLRNNLKTFWKNLAEERGDQVVKLQADLKQLAQQLVDAQLSHTNELHALNEKLLKVEKDLEFEKAKRDLTGVMDRLDALDHTVLERGPLFDRIAAGFDAQAAALGEIIAGLQPKEVLP